jgi:hypothetical protein
MYWDGVYIIGVYCKDAGYLGQNRHINKTKGIFVLTMSHLVFSLTILLIAQFAYASKEGVLVLSNFIVTSQGIGASGAIEVSGTQSTNGIERLKISAFGKSMSLTPATLEKLRCFFANGIALSYESGFKEQGGKTLYITVIRQFSTHTVSTKTISFCEDNSVTVSDSANYVATENLAH